MICPMIAAPSHSLVQDLLSALPASELQLLQVLYPKFGHICQTPVEIVENKHDLKASQIEA
eukprot:1433670-Rhodomonas_salina.1